MQFIEKNSFNVRSAIYRLESEGSGLEFLLFPMIHVGSQEFYDEVSRRLAKCDLILAEGVASRKAALLTRSYRIVKKIKRMGLVTQREALNIYALRDKILNTDIDGRSFDKGWASLPLSFRAQVFFLMPVYLIYMLLFGTRETIAENIAVEDLPSSLEVLSQDDDFEKLEALVIDERDLKLIRAIESLHEKNGMDKKIVGVLYGARHMSNLVDFMIHKLKYRVTKAEWVMVFDL